MLKKISLNKIKSFFNKKLYPKLKIGGILLSKILLLNLTDYKNNEQI